MSHLASSSTPLVKPSESVTVVFTAQGFGFGEAWDLQGLGSSGFPPVTIFIAEQL